MGKRLNLYQKMRIIDEAFINKMDYQQAVINVMGNISDSKIEKIIKDIESSNDCQRYVRFKYLQIHCQILENIKLPIK